jgi:hypothetical protein
MRWSTTADCREHHELMERSKTQKAVVIVSGIAFLSSSVLSIGGLIASSLNKPAATETPTQSQNAQLKAQEEGLITVSKREPKNPIPLRGLVELRMRKGDISGTKAALEQLVKIEPANKEYKEFLAAVNKQITDTKKVGTLKSTEPKQPTSPAK